MESDLRPVPENLDLEGAMAALRRAGLRAREEAMNANTSIVVVQDGKLQRISPRELDNTEPVQALQSAITRSVPQNNETRRPDRRDSEIDALWYDVTRAAVAACNSGATLISRVRGHHYMIRSVDEDRIVIRRMSGGKDEILRRGDLENAILRLDAAGGRIRRTDLNSIVAKVVALVEFVPMLSWSADSQYVLRSAATGSQRS